MIKLDIKNYCHSCTEFDPEVEYPKHIYTNGDITVSSNTVIRCKERAKCENFMRHLKGEEMKPNKQKPVADKTADWLVWAGWRGNHDCRIEGTKCSNCGFEHPTVYGSTDKLYAACPNCNSVMNIKELNTF